MQDLLRGGGQLVVRGVHGIPPARRVQLAHELGAREVGELEQPDHPWRDAAHVGNGGLRHPGHLVGREVADRPHHHRRGRIPLLEREQGKLTISLPGDRLLGCTAVEGGVLQGMRVFVGVGDLRRGRQPCIGHDHHPLGVEVVVAGHLGDVQPLGQLHDVLLGGKQAQGAQGGVVEGRLQKGGQHLLQLGPGQDLRWTDLSRRQAAQLLDLRLDLGEGGHQIL